MERARISVIIPAYNAAEWIRDALESALMQTVRADEVIVVDDGSTDNTKEIVEGYGARGVQYFRQANQGVSAARNVGVRHSKGEWIAFLDADDVWHRDKLKVQLETYQTAIAERTASDVGIIGSRAVPELPSVLPPNPRARWVPPSEFLLWMPMYVSGIVVRRRCFDEVGLFDTAFGPAADRDMWLRVAAKFETLQVDSPCWWYRVHSGQMSGKAVTMNSEFGAVLDKFFAEHPAFRKFRRLAYSYLDFDGAVAYLEAGKRFDAIAALVRSAARHPVRFPWAGARGCRSKLMCRLLLGESVFRLFCQMKDGTQGGVSPSIAQERMLRKEPRACDY